MQAASSKDAVALLDDYTDPSAWLNDVLEEFAPSAPGTSPTTGGSLTDLDRRVSELAAALEIACEDTTSFLERTIDDISRGVPRLTYDLQFMRQNALSLQSSLLKIESQSDASLPKSETTEALEKLHHLDLVKRRMEAAREVLREAESWSTLESEIVSLLSEPQPNYEKAAERLAEANRSMIVFQNTPEYEPRRTLMVSLQNQLEASLSSALVAAISSQDVSVCQNYFTIFSNIQRESEFRNYYNGSRRGPIVDIWTKAQLSDCDGSPSSPSGIPDARVKLAGFMPSFYTAFLSLLNTERTSIPSIFPDPQQTLSTLITSTFSALQPTLNQRLSSLQSHHGPAVLPELIAVFKATEDFALSTDKIMEKVAYAAAATSNPPPFSPTNTSSQPPDLSSTSTDSASLNRSHSRRRSQRMSMSRRMGPRVSISLGNPTLILPGAISYSSLDLGWDQELFEPFIDYQVDYVTLETRFLDDALKSAVAQTASAPGKTDAARLLRERSVDVFSFAEDSLGRCLTFTHGYASVGLLKALNQLFETFMSTSRDEALASRTQPTSITPGSVGIAEEDLTELDYTAEDWSAFQLYLHLLDAARSVLERLHAFESKLRSSLMQVSGALRIARTDPQGIFLPNTTRGEARLLAQSTLNSLELTSLMDTVDPDTSYNTPGVPLLTPASAVGARTFAQSQQLQTVPMTPLLVGARTSIAGFSKACQTSLIDTILSPLLKHLSTYASQPAWSVAPDATRPRRGDLQMPTFSLSPTNTMQRISEGLLNLPRLFEVYADDDALAFSLETLPFVNDELLKALSDPAQQQPGSENLDVPSSKSQAHTRRSASLSNRAALSTPSVITPVTLSPEAVSSVWLSSLTSTLLSHFTLSVLPSISTLSMSGAAQLASDLGYLSNIVRALNVEWEQLERWRECTELEENDGRAKLGDNELADDVLRSVARMRGWTTS